MGQVEIVDATALPEKFFMVKLEIHGDIFFADPGLWRAWLVDHEGRKIQCGVIPSKYKIEEELLQRSSLADLDHESRRSSTSARRSFFRRRKHTRSSSRDSKELASFSDASLGQMGSCEGLGLSAMTAMQVRPLRPLTASFISTIVRSIGQLAILTAVFIEKKFCNGHLPTHYR